MANWCRSKISLKVVKTGIFSTQEKCFSGSDLYALMSSEYPKDEQLTHLCQDLITYEFIHPVLNNYKFSKEDRAYYIFQQDRPNLINNMIKVWYEDVRKPLEVTCDIIRQLNKLLLEIRPFSPKILEIPNDYANNSKDYRKFLDSICELQRIDLNVKNMEKDEILAFFLNLYQVIILNWGLVIYIFLIFGDHESS